MAKPWFRYHAEVLHNKRVQSCPDHLFKTWVNCNCILAEDNVGRSGLLPPVEDCAYRLRMSVEETVKRFNDLVEKGLLSRRKVTKDETVGNAGERFSETVGPQNGPEIETLFETFHYNYYVNKWGEKQFKSDVSTQRVRNFRQKKKALQETLGETAPDQIRSDTDTDQIREKRSFHSENEIGSIDGSNDSWKKPFGSVFFDIDRHLQEDDRQEARSAAPGWDQKHLMRKFNEFINSKGERPDYPVQAYISWCGKFTKGKRPQ